MCFRLHLFDDEDDCLQRLHAIFVLLIGSYKVLSCTLLSIFIPQRCITEQCNFFFDHIKKSFVLFD